MKRKFTAIGTLAVIATAFTACITPPPPLPLGARDVCFAAADYSKELKSKLTEITNSTAEIDLLECRAADVDETLGFGVYHAHIRMTLGVLAEQYFVVEFGKEHGQWMPQGIKFMFVPEDTIKPERSSLLPQSKTS